MVRRVAQVAVVAQLVFVASFLIAASWQGPGYSAAAHSMSDMYAVTAPNGMFLVVVFTLYGVAMLLFAALSMWPTLRLARWWAAAGSVVFALSIFGLGNVLSPFERLACRMADPGCSANAQAANAGGALDNALSFPGILLFAFAVFLIASAMKRTPGWQRWTWPARWAGLAFILMLVADIVAYALNLGVGGLMERLLATTGSAIVAAFAWGIQAGVGEPVPARTETDSWARRLG